MKSLIHDFFFAPGSELEVTHVICRAFAVYLLGLFLLRLTYRRVIGKESSFDMIVLVVFGSILSRAVNGGADLTSALAGSAALIFIHWLITEFSFRFPRLGKIIKGSPILLIKGGSTLDDEIRRQRMGKDDLDEELRLNRVKGTDRVELSYLEANGRISFLTKPE
jgi:uncharacterized membrane protein YcaP (DUF421 family)